jgi:ribonucleoside-diphosphate reductase alpha chain
MRVLEKRYLRGETPEQMFWRVASAVAQAESPNEANFYASKFYNMMCNLDFLPNSPTLMNAGRPLGQLSACFVLPVNDSMEEIFNAVKWMAMIQKSGGGTGFSFSRLRPKGDAVDTTNGVASGPVSFMKVFNAATDVIKQGGARRGANMGILRVDHPDIVDFIASKKVEGEISNFNISVGITDEFMEALRNGTTYKLKFKGKERGKFPAKWIFDLIIEGIWKNGEPGIVFLDEINRHNPTPDIGEIESTNPCGEQPLLPFEACNLGSINLVNMFKEGTKYEKDWQIDWDKLAETVKMAVRFLDDVIEINQFPIAEIEKISRGNRKIGLGLMGWADLLIKLRLPYDSEEALKLASEIMKEVNIRAYQESIKLAKIRGSFPNLEYSIYKDAQRDGLALRNATRTTIAPTGTLSMIADVSSGIEPVFALAYSKSAVDEEFANIHSLFRSYLIHNFNNDTYKSIIEEVVKTGSCQHINVIPKTMRAVFKTATEISPEAHIRMQAAFQEHCDNAVSKTINFPNSATKEDIKKAILLAYELKCKGLTMYRVGSRKVEALKTGANTSPQQVQEAPKTNKDEVVSGPRQRPSKLYGFTKGVRSGCGKLYVTVNQIDGEPFETFITTGSAGGCQAFAEGVSRLLSLALRANVSPDDIIDQLTSVTCPNFVRRKATDKTLEGKSCPDAIGRVLMEAMDEGTLYSVGVDLSANKDITVTKEENAGVAVYAEAECPDCHAPLELTEGCLKCRSCGWSKCD